MDQEPTADREQHDFSLVVGGPLYQLLLRAHLVQPSMEWLNRRILACVLITWLPLALLTALAGTFAGGVKVPFLYDLSNVGLLVSLPMLLGAELFVHRRMRHIADEFLERELIAPEDRPRFETCFVRSVRLRNSIVAEVLLLAFSWTGGYWVWSSYVTLQVQTWYAVPGDGSVQFTPAGYWLAFVSMPIARFIVLRWYFRLFIWYRFAWWVSRLPLRLNPLHPDRAGGLGFLEHSVTALVPLLIPQSIHVAAVIGNEIWHEGTRLPDFKFEIAGFVAILMLVTLLPLTFFILHLVEAKLVALREFGQLADRYARAFQQKWFPSGAAPAEALLGTADIQSLADLANSYEIVRGMRPVPFDRSVVLRLAIVIALPLAPLTLTMVPIDELVPRLLKLLM